MKNCTRRDIMLAGACLLLSGCAGGTSGNTYHNPPARTGRGDQPVWPTINPHPSNTAYTAPRYTPSPQPTYTPPQPPPSTANQALSIIPRARWTQQVRPVNRDVHAMGQVNRITVHHEGFHPVWFADEASTIRRLEAIRRFHTDERKWADVGYHYLIDRSGRIWEGRDSRLQGAHVRNHNENNLGIMLLGNFDNQRPTPQQMTSLERALAVFARQHRVPANRIYSHRELPSNTTCPGSSLQDHMNNLRRGLA